MSLELRKPLKRNRSTWTRNGCDSCKSKHVKCGEEKPTCLRCQRAGRNCIYNPPKARLFSSNTQALRRSTEAGYTTNVRLVYSPLRIPWKQETAATASLSATSFDYFVASQASRSPPGPGSKLPWDVPLIYTLYHEEPAFHYVFNAFCTLNLALRYPVSSEATSFYFESLDFSMRTLRARSLVHGASGFVHAAVLLALTETQRTGDAAICDAHIDKVDQIVESWRQECELLPAPDSIQAGALMRLRARLAALRRENLVLLGTERARREVQTRTLSSSGPRSAQVRPGFQEESSLHVPVLRNTMQVAIALKQIISPAMVLAQACIGNALWPECKRRIRATRSGLEAWAEAFEQYVTLDGDGRGLAASKVSFLRAHLHSCLLMTRLYDLSTENQCVDYAVEFDHILRLLQDALSDGSWRRDGWFRILGIIPVAAFVAFRCRAPDIRRQALALLRDMNTAEGEWNSTTAAVVAEMIIDIEADAAPSGRVAEHRPLVRVVVARCYFDSGYTGATVELEYADTRSKPACVGIKRKRIDGFGDIEALTKVAWPLDSVLRTYGSMVVKIMPCQFLQAAGGSC